MENSCLDVDRGSLGLGLGLGLELPREQRWRIADADMKQTVAFTLPFAQRTDVTGPMALKLWVSAEDADDLDLYVAVRKFNREGREVHFYGKDGIRDGVVALGWQRLSQRRLDTEKSTPWRPYLSHDRVEKVQADEIVPVDIEILPSSTLFEAGESLRLVIGGREIVEQARFGHDETVSRGRFGSHAGGARRYFRYTVGTDTSAVSQELHLTSPGDARFRYVSGAWFGQNTYKQTDEWNLTYPPPLGATRFINSVDQKTTSASAFGQADFDIVNRLTLSGDIRPCLPRSIPPTSSASGCCGGARRSTSTAFSRTSRRSCAHGPNGTTNSATVIDRADLIEIVWGHLSMLCR